MPQISLGSYTLRVRKKYQSKGEEEYEELGSIGDAGADFHEFLEQFFDRLYIEHQVDENRQTMLQISESQLDDRTSQGFAEAGPWGAEADIVNHRTREQTHHMSTEEAALFPFFFLVDVPRTSARGIMILQRHGRRGIKSHFGLALKKAFSEWQEGYMLEVWRHVPGSVLDQLTRGRLRQVELISYDLPSDQADYDAILSDDNAEWEENRGEVRVRITARRGLGLGFPGLFRSVVAGDRTFHEVRERLGVPDDGRILLTVNQNGHERTIDLADPGNISPYVDISNQVRLLENGHPDPEDLTKAAQDLLTQLREQVRADEQ